MPQFNDAQQVEQLCYELKLADFPRGQNRARINQLFNGWPPYSESEVQENNITVNVNSLEGTGLAHDARSQFYGAFLRPGNFFRATTDMGPAHRRDERGAIVTRHLNRMMKRSLPYFEHFRSKFASVVLHGTGPGIWDNPDCWCPDPIGVEDVLVPGKTLLTMKNLPLFAIYHSFTAPELIKLTRGPHVDPAWNMDLVESAIEWVDKETLQLLGSTWPEVWSPEKMQERVKGDGGFYPGDTAPTVDCFDFYFWDDDGEQSGWKRRIILDSWGAPASMGAGKYTMGAKSGDFYKSNQGQFLYNSGDRIFADRREQMVGWIFGDLSAVSPFQYHSVRGLGFLLYSVCHLQNRLRCKFSEAVFEALLNYFRVKTEDDFQRALKVQLANRGFIDDTIQFVPAAERWQVNAQLVELGLSQNQGLINQHASRFTSQPERGSERPEMTATQWIGESQNTTQLVSAAFTQAYQYQTFEYYEILRRAMKKHSRDPEVIGFQGACLREGLPAEYLTPEAWELDPERVMGNGNTSLEMAIANWLMQNREKYEPDAQRKILRKATFSISSDPGLANELVPEKPEISDSIHDAQLAAAGLLLGLPMALKQGVNHQEYAQALLAALAQQVQKIGQRNNVATMEELQGLQNLAGQTIQGAPVQGNGARNHIAVLEENPQEKQTVRQLGNLLGKLMNLVKAFAQRLAQQQQQAQSQGPGMEPKDMAKLQAMQLQAKTKTDNARQSHAQRTAQRQIQFEQEIQQSREEHAHKMAAIDLQAQADVRHRDQIAAIEQQKRLASVEE